MAKRRKTASRAISDQALLAVARRFKLLGEVDRLKIINLLEGEPRTAKEIAQRLGLSSAQVMRHLKTMTRADLLAASRTDGQEHYSILEPAVFEIRDLMCASLQRKIIEHAKTFDL